MSIWDNAIRIASDGVFVFSSHHAKRCPDKLPGRKVIRSGVLLLIEAIRCLRDFSEKLMNAVDRSEVSVVKAV